MAFRAVEIAQASSLGMFLATSAMLQSLPEEVASVGGTTNATTHRTWLDAHHAREAIREKWAEFFGRFDAV